MAHTDISVLHWFWAQVTASLKLALSTDCKFTNLDRNKEKKHITIPIAIQDQKSIYWWLQLKRTQKNTLEQYVHFVKNLSFCDFCGYVFSFFLLFSFCVFVFFLNSYFPFLTFVVSCFFSNISTTSPIEPCLN